MKKANLFVQPASEMTEEEQIDAAIRKSLDKNLGIHGLKNDRSDREFPVPLPKQHSQDRRVSHNSNEPSGVIKDETRLIKRSEPGAEDINMTRIQFRLPDGQKIIRRFLIHDPVSYLFDFLRTEVPSLHDQSLEVRTKKLHQISSL